MQFQDYLEDHINFILILGFYFLPAITGAAFTTFIKYADKCDKSIKCTTRTIMLMFFSALIPSVVLSAINEYLVEIIESSALRIGVAFVFGCVGDETLEIVTSLRKMSSLLKILSKYIEKLKKFSNAAGEIIDELNKEDASDENVGSNNKNDNSPHPPHDDFDDFYLE